jgi:hypothetical protein
MTDRRHALEIDANVETWREKALLRDIYAGFYDRILCQVDGSAAGAIVEIGSGVGNLKERLPTAIASDLYLNTWLNLVWQRILATATRGDGLASDPLRRLP